MRITKTGAHNFLSRVKNLCASKSARPVLVILIHPNADYAGKNVLLTNYYNNNVAMVGLNIRQAPEDRRMVEAYFLELGQILMDLI